MSLRARITGFCALCLAAVAPARAADINQCAMVADGRAEVIDFDTRLPDGKVVNVQGILAGPSGDGPFPAIVMLPGGGSLYTPNCFAYFVKQFIRWGYVTLIVASSTARDIAGRRLYEYSFLDQSMHGRGAVSFLATRTTVAPSRIGIWGFSRGGLTAIELASSVAEGSGAFRAVVAAAPHCPAGGAAPHIPLLVMIGTGDRIVSVDACVDYAARLGRAAGFEFLMLKDAGHIFWDHTPAARLSSETMRAFLVKHLGREP